MSYIQNLASNVVKEVSEKFKNIDQEVMLHIFHNHSAEGILWYDIKDLNQEVQYVSLDNLASMQIKISCKSCKKIIIDWRTI